MESKKNSINNNNHNNNVKPENYTHEQFVYLICLSDKCGRYEDVLSSFEMMIKRYSSTTSLTKDELLIFEKAMKQVIQVKQRKLNKLYNLEKANNQEDVEHNTVVTSIINEEKNLLENELKVTCKKLLKLIDNYIMKNVADKESEVFFYRIKADLYKYMSQVDEQYEKYLNLADKYYEDAIQISSKSLSVTNVIYLNTVVAYAKFLLNFLKDEEKSLKILNLINKNKEIKEIVDGIKIVTDNEVLEYLKEIKNMISSIQD